jgi:hypothetical protein
MTEQGVDTRGNQDKQDETQTVIQRETHARAAAEARGPQDGRYNSQLANHYVASIKSTQEGLPQVAEANTPQPMDVAGECLL